MVDEDVNPDILEYQIHIVLHGVCSRYEKIVNANAIDLVWRSYIIYFEVYETLIDTNIVLDQELEFCLMYIPAQCPLIVPRRDRQKEMRRSNVSCCTNYKLLFTSTGSGTLKINLAKDPR